MTEYQGYTIGDIISENWEILNIERKEKSGKNRIIFTVKCINCGYIDENEVYMILRRKSCRHCRQNELQSMIGLRQGRLQILQISPEKHSNGSTQFICQCDCGSIFVTTYSSIKRGTGSCGCLNMEPTTLRHGMTGTRIHGIWKNTKTVCNNPNSTNYYAYGARGIRMCPEWENSFEAFYEWAMNNGYNDELKLTRYDDNRDFCPENCYWITQDELNYRKSNNVKVMYYGREFTMQDFAIMCNEFRETIYRQYYNNNLDRFLINKEGDTVRQINQHFRKMRGEE